MPRYSTILLLVIACRAPEISSTTQGGNSEATTQILRSWVPWWPKDHQFNLKSLPNVTSILKSSPIDDKGAVPNSTRSSSEVGNGVVDGTQLKLNTPPASPLDALNPEKAQKSGHDEFLMDFDQLGDCPKDCSTDLRDALSIMLQDMSHIERYHKICGKYHGALKCVKEDERCGEEDRGMFEMMTSGLNYMCIEQEMAFNSTIKCIDDESALVQSECEDQCQTRNLFINWILRSTMQDTIQQGVNGIVGAATGGNPNPFAFLQPQNGQGAWTDVIKPPKPVSTGNGLESFRAFTNDICKIGDCMLDCIRSKFNTRCEGSAGTLLSEMFVRPIAASQNKLTILRPVLGMFMPEHCSYVYSSSQLKKHRIDSTMDTELKRMYAEKYQKEINERTAQDELLSKLVPLDANGVPLPKAVPDLKIADESPLDIIEKSLDQLILELYKNVEPSNTTEIENNRDSFEELSDFDSNSTISILEMENEAQSQNFTTVITNATTTTELEGSASGESWAEEGNSTLFSENLRFSELSSGEASGEESGSGSGETEGSGIEVDHLLM